jgi:hypothetical protein
MIFAAYGELPQIVNRKSQIVNAFIGSGDAEAPVRHIFNAGYIVCYTVEAVEKARNGL